MGYNYDCRFAKSTKLLLSEIIINEWLIKELYMSEKLPPGKLDMSILKSLLDRYAVCNDERVVVGPSIGEDVAVIDFGEKYLVAKTAAHFVGTALKFVPQRLLKLSKKD